MNKKNDYYETTPLDIATRGQERINQEKQWDLNRKNSYENKLKITKENFFSNNLENFKDYIKLKSEIGEKIHWKVYIYMAKEFEKNENGNYSNELKELAVIILKKKIKLNPNFSSKKIIDFFEKCISIGALNYENIISEDENGDITNYYYQNKITDINELLYLLEKDYLPWQIEFVAKYNKINLISIKHK